MHRDQQHNIELPFAEIHVWTIKLDSLCYDLGYLSSLLNAGERLRASRFHFQLHRNDWIITRAGLREILSRYTGQPAEQLTFQTGRYGKPKLVRSACGLQFNLTHTKGIALVAVSKQPVGIDAERIDTTLDWQALASGVCSEREYQQLLKSKQALQHRRFYQLWTRKEAYMKGRGLGFSLPLKAFHVPVNDAVEIGRVEVDPAWDDGKMWQLIALPSRSSDVASLACCGTLSNVQHFIWNEKDAPVACKPRLSCR